MQKDSLSVGCSNGCMMRGLSRCFCASVSGGPRAAAGPSKACAASIPQEVEFARKEAAEARDIRKNGEALVNLWREASKPRKGGAIAPKPHGAKLDFPDLFEQWLAQRGLTDKLERAEDKDGWFVWKYTKDPVVRSEPHWETAFHGTWWYAAWMIMESGILLESNDRSLGHDFWQPGVYCSPNVDTGLWYARPQILFGDGVYHRVIFELRVDPDKRMKNRQRGGVQWVFPGTAVALHAVWVQSNAPPANGEERVNEWEPELEALPKGMTYPEAIVNPRTGPWPEHFDPFAWDVSENNVPPWMRSGKPNPAPVKSITPTPGPNAKKRKNVSDDWAGWPSLFSWGFETAAGGKAAALAAAALAASWWGPDDEESWWAGEGGDGQGYGQGGDGWGCGKGGCGWLYGKGAEAWAYGKGGDGWGSPASSLASWNAGASWSGAGPAKRFRPRGSAAASSCP